MKDSIFHSADIKTPAYVYDQTSVEEVLNVLCGLKSRCGCIPLYSIKSVNLAGILKIVKPFIDGYSCSSLFETKLAKEVLGLNQTIHITTPGYRDDEWEELITMADFISLNSISQWQRMAKTINGHSSCGIRINPEISFVKDDRYDPCRPDSKLGITLSQIEKACSEAKVDWQYIEGIHIHNNCESTNLAQLEQSIEHVMSKLKQYKLILKWINLGGGYFFNKDIDLAPLENIVKRLQDDHGVAVFIEPGKAITGKAGYLVTTVIDLIESNNKQIAVLDTSINHLPEVFEYQYQPDVLESSKEGHEYCLVGCSCLSGDLFGDYFFDTPLQLGSRIVFENAGSYMQVKANMFNGINLPSCYLADNKNQIKLIKEYNYDSFRDRL